MGKHTKRNGSLPGRSAPEQNRDWDAQEDRIDFDLLFDDDVGNDEFYLDAEDLFAEEAEKPYALDTAADEPVVHEVEEDVTAYPEESASEEDASEEDVSEEAPPPPARKPAAKSDSAKKKPAGKKKTSAPAKSRKAAARSKKRFRRGLTAYLLVLLVLIIGTLVYEWYALGESQKRMDAEAAEEAARKAAIAEQQAYEKAVYRAPQLAFEAWRAATTPDYWTDLWLADNGNEFDQRDGVRDYMAARFENAEPFKALDYTAAAPVYVLKDGEDTLARVTLAGSELNWNVSGVEMFIHGTESASVRVASGSKVTCNGVALGSEHIVNSDSYFKYEPLQDKLVNPVSWDTYEVHDLLLKPELAVEPPTGGIITETAEGDFLMCLDDAAGQTYKDRSVAFVKSYLFYYMSGYNGTWGNLYAALAHLTPGYQAYKDLQDTYNGVVWNTAYGNIDTSKTTAGDVVIWADNCYSVDVTYDADCTLNGQAVDYADATMRIYFLKTDAGFIISNFETL